MKQYAGMLQCRPQSLLAFFSMWCLWCLVL